MYQVKLSGTARLTTVGVVLSALIAMSAPAGATRAGPIDAVTVSPGQVEVEAPADLTFTFAASPSEPFHGEAGTVVPGGWTAPQAEDAAAPGYVSVDAGTCKRARLRDPEGQGPWLIVVDAHCGAGASFTVLYAGTAAPAPTGLVTFHAGSRHRGSMHPVSPAPTVEVVPIPLAELRLSGTPSGAVAGDPVAITVEALDQHGDRAVRQSSTLAVSSTDGHAVLPATVDLREGVATIAGELRTAGLQMITVETTGDGPARSASTPEIAVRAGPLATIAIDAPGPSVVAGVPTDFDLRGADRFGNPVDAGGAVLTAGPDASCAGWTCTAWSAGHMDVAAGPDGASGSAVLEVAPEVVSVAPPTLPDAMLQEAYSTTLTAPGSIRGATFSVVGGSLPAGLSLSASGALAGRPSSLGPSTFTVRATDGNGVSGQRTFALTVTLPILVDVSEVDFGSLPVGARSAAVRVTLTNRGSVSFVLGARGLTNRNDFAAPVGDDSCFTAEPLEPGRSCSALVTFTPSAPGARTGTLEWAYDIGTVTLRLRGHAT